MSVSLRNWIKSILLDEDHLDQVLSEYQEQQLKTQQPVIRLIEANLTKLEAHHTEKRRLIDACAAGVFTLDEVAEKKATLNRLMNDLEQAIERLQAELEPNTLTQDDIDFIKTTARKIRGQPT